MAIPGVKNATIEKRNLPAVGPNNEYYVRYRIVSDIGDRKSHWSPIYKVFAKDLQLVQGSVSILGSGITVIWDDEEDRPRYDIFVKFDGGQYSYHGTSPIHTYSFIKTGTTSVQVAIQVEGIRKERNAALQIYESSVISLV
jgi:hypothetical protein